MTTLRTRRTYDHRIREMICETGDPDLFPELKIPRSTIQSWLHRGVPDVVTCDPLPAEKAGRHLGTRAAETTVMTDSGAENVNGNVDALLDREGLRRVLAQVEVSFSNSMIEAFWRSLRHAWLYLHNLDNTATLRCLIEFYVRAHNETMPHAAFNGQTPDEVYFGNGDAVVIDLAAARVRARQQRMKANRMAACGVCDADPDFGALHLQRPERAMS